MAFNNAAFLLFKEGIHYGSEFFLICQFEVVATVDWLIGACVMAVLFLYKLLFNGVFRCLIHLFCVFVDFIS